MDDEKLYQQFLNSFRLGLKKEAGNKYDITNKDSNALGKYQFVPKYWWNNKPTKMDSIPEYARKKGYGELKSYDDFLKNPTLQEDYFEAYTKKQVYPKAKELYKNYGAKRGLRIDEIGALIHFQGEGGADTIVKTGKHKGATSINPSTQEDLRRYNDALVSSGGKGVSKTYATAVLVDKNVAKKEFRDMNSRIDAIQKQTDLSQDVKNLKINDVKKDYYKKGYFDIDEKGQPVGIFNDFVTEENVKKQKDFSLNLKKTEKKLKLINQATIYTESINGISYIDKIDLGSYNSEKDDNLLFDKDLIKYTNAKVIKLPNPSELKKLEKDGAVVHSINSSKAIYYKIDPHVFLTDTQNEYRKLTGNNEFELISQGDPYKKGKNLTIDMDNESVLLDKLTPGRSKLYGTAENLTEKINGVFKNDVHGVPFLTVNPEWQQEVMQEQEALQPKVEDAKPNVPPPSTSNPRDYTPQDIEGAKNQALAEGYNKSVTETPVQPKEDDLSVYNDYWNLETDKPETGAYDPSQYKSDFPFADVLGSAAMVLQGSKMANTELPVRDEQVSDSFRNFTSELAKLSQIGLRPEEEAYAKRMLTESYQSGIEQIVKASGGNRNAVLGNLGRLDYQKQKGLLDLSVADAQMKNEALFKYGEAVKYINEFDANRDIANNERKYENAMLTKQTGGQLMAKGFQDLMDNIQYYKENKPGSANHAYKSYMYRKMFDVDPTLKDDGTGETPYTLSWKKKQDEEKLTKYYGNKATAEKAMALSPEQKKIAQKVMIESGGNSDIANGVINHLFESKSTGENIDLSKLPDAVKNKDYSLLFNNNPIKENSNNIQAQNGVFSNTLSMATPTFVSSDNTSVYEKKEPVTSFQNIFQTPATEPQNPENKNSIETPDYIKNLAKDFFGEGGLQYLESTKH